MTDRRPKGSGTIETTPEGMYRARFPFNIGAREEVGTYASYNEAAGALDGILAELRQAGGIRGMSLRRLGERTLNLREKEGYKAVETDRQRWATYFDKWECLVHPASTLTRGDIREWLADLTSLGLAVQTRRNTLNLLRAVLQTGVDDELLAENVAVGIRIKSRGATEETSTWLTKEETDRLISASNDPAVVLAITTGLRQGELRSLLWSDVREDHIVVRYGKPGASTKGGRIRDVELLDQARAALDSLPRTHRMVLPTPRGCFRPKGRMVSPADWDTWLVAAGITRRVRWHDLRHTCATLLLTGAWGGEPWTMEAVKEMLGHSSIKVTERYAKATGTLSRRAARAMRKPRTSPKGDDSEEAQVLDIVSRRGSDSNRRMTVLQTDVKRNDSNYLDYIVALARAYLEAVAEGSAFAHQHGRALAESVLDLAADDEGVITPAASS